MGKDDASTTATSSDRHRDKDRDKEGRDAGSRRHKHREKEKRRDRERSRSRSHSRDRQDRDHKDKDRDSERKHKKRRKNRDDDDANGEDKKKKHKHRKRDKHRSRSRSRSKDRDGDTKMTIMDDDAKANDEDMWFEKDLSNDGERVLATDIPTAESLRITSSAQGGSSVQRDEWMLAPHSNVASSSNAPARSLLDSSSGAALTDGYGEGESSGPMDFFSSLGSERQKKPKTNRPDPDKPVISSKELNLDLKEGRTMDFDAPPAPPPTNTPGGPGSSWRMMRLRRVYETAEEEGRSLEEVGTERFGTLEAFNEAREERRILDERDGHGGAGRGSTPSNKPQGGGRDSDQRGRPMGTDRPTHFSKDGEKRLMFTDMVASGGSSRSSSFRRPGGAPTHGSNNNDSAPATPSPPSGTYPNAKGPVNKRLDSLRLPSQANSPLAQSHTPIPSVMTPPSAAASGSGSKGRALSPSSLNRLQAKVIRAKLMGTPDAEKLEKEYEEEARRAQGIVVDEDGVRKKVEVLPTLDARGQMYDVGHGKDDDPKGKLPGNRRKKEPKFETHDRKTGEVVRINADDDELTLGEMLRQERMGAGISDQKNLDAQYAKAIMGDGKFQNDLDYIDDNAEKLGRQKMRSDAMKRQFAINDYKRTQKAMSSCSFCYGEDDSPPKAPVIAMGTRVYLSCTLTEELVPGHCLIVPIQHHLNMLEGDDDVWDETRNFMKCLMRMFAAEDKGVVFFETVLSLRKQKHSYIECVPVPWEQFDVLPGYFKESILASEAEWSQHKKLIDFGARPGGFRRAMVPNLPYFMVQFDHKGEKGYGHVIEGAADAQDEDGLEEGEKGGGAFPWYFAGEIIGNVLEVETRRWRRPKRVGIGLNESRVLSFRKKYGEYDWTGLI